MSTIIKALEILDLFSPAQPSLGLSEAARLLNRDKASVLRHLTALQAKGLVEQDSKTKFYHLGPALSRLSMMREQTAPANHAINNLVQRLALDTGETTHLTRYSNGRLIHGKIINTQTSGTAALMNMPICADGFSSSSRIPLLLFSEAATDDWSSISRASSWSPSIAPQAPHPHRPRVEGGARPAFSGTHTG